MVSTYTTFSHDNPLLCPKFIFLRNSFFFAELCLFCEIYYPEIWTIFSVLHLLWDENPSGHSAGSDGCLRTHIRSWYLYFPRVYLPYDMMYLGGWGRNIILENVSRLSSCLLKKMFNMMSCDVLYCRRTIFN